MPDLNTISPAQLMRLIGTPDAPVIVDVRTPEDRDTNPRILPASILHPHTDVAHLPTRLAGQRSVIVCHKGKKLSHGTAAYLRDAGLASEVLAGGFVAWAAAGLMTVPISARVQGSIWVTRHRPKIDRIACPWLIRRFIDPQARFLFVPPAEVADVAERFDATPFDVGDVPLTHHDARCTFDAMIAAFGLDDDALNRVADVVRAADTNSHEKNAQAAGLLAISVGLSRMFRDDTAQLNAAMPLYDALYRWARDGYDEGHDTLLGQTQ